jgi:hypothetical protein
LLCADDLALFSFTINWFTESSRPSENVLLQIGIKNVKKLKILVFRKGDRLKKSGSWTEYNQRAGKRNKLLGSNSGKWMQQIDAQCSNRRKDDLIAVDEYSARTPNIRMKILKNVYVILSESGMIYIFKISGLCGEWKQTDKIDITLKEYEASSEFS